MTRWAFIAPLLLLLGLFIHSAVSQEAEDPAATVTPLAPDQASDGTEDDSGDWGMNSLRGGFESVSSYFDSMLEFMGGRDGVCQYRCRYGDDVYAPITCGGVEIEGQTGYTVLYSPEKEHHKSSATEFYYIGDKADFSTADISNTLQLKPKQSRLINSTTGKAPLPRPGYQMPEPDGCSSYFFGIPIPEGMDVGIPAMTKCCNQLDMCYDTCGSNKYRCDSKFRWCLHSICSDLKKSLGFVSKVEACETVADTLFNTVWTLGCRPYMNAQRAACYCQGEEKDEL